MSFTPSADPSTATLVLSGRLDVVSLAEVLQLLGASCRSGVLTIERDAPPESVEIELLNGRVVRAVLSSAPDPLGAVLLRQKSLEAPVLGEALRRQSAAVAWRPLGSVLLEMEAVEPGQLVCALAEQVEIAIARSLTWRRGLFRFRRLPTGPSAEARDLRVFLDPQRILLRAATRADETSATVPAR